VTRIGLLPAESTMLASRHKLLGAFSLRQGDLGELRFAKISTTENAAAPKEENVRG
jgi:hypothetical protein